MRTQSLVGPVLLLGAGALAWGIWWLWPAWQPASETVDRMFMATAQVVGVGSLVALAAASVWWWRRT